MKEKERKENFRIDSPDLLESLLASSTWRPGKARPPLSTAREAWIKSRKNSWVMSLIFMAAGSGFSYYFSLRQTVEGFILAVGAGVLAGVTMLLIFFAAFLARELMARRRGEG